MIADESRHAGRVPRRTGADRASAVSVAPESGAAVLGAHCLACTKGLGSAIFDPGRPSLPVGKGCRGTFKVPGIFASIEGHLDDKVRRSRVRFGRRGPNGTPVPVHLSGSGPGLVQRVGADAAVGQDQVLIAVGLGEVVQAEGRHGREGLEGAGDGHFEATDVMRVNLGQKNEA